MIFECLKLLLLGISAPQQWSRPSKLGTCVPQARAHTPKKNIEIEALPDFKAPKLCTFSSTMYTVRCHSTQHMCFALKTRRACMWPCLFIPATATVQIRRAWRSVLARPCHIASTPPPMAANPPFAPARPPVFRANLAQVSRETRSRDISDYVQCIVGSLEGAPIRTVYPTLFLCWLVSLEILCRALQ